jgi:hypothetical protein
MSNNLSWSPQEASAINEFLNSAIGRKWLTILMTRKPRLDLSSTERAALTGTFAAGYEAFFHQIGATRDFQTEEMQAAKSIDPTRD